MSWWSDFYKRPLKDPILQEYSLEELAYEFFIHSERRIAEKEAIEAANDKIEEDKQRANEEWADRMERLEMEEEARREAAEAAAAAKAKETPPAEDPANIAWMEEQLAKNKKELGEDFGEDLHLDFEKD